MRKGFTLIELIFVIVVIGILSVVALPKFTNLKQNAEVSNMIKAYTAIMSSGPSAYINATELNGISATEVGIETLMKISPYSTDTTKTKGWIKNSDDSFTYYLDTQDYMKFDYGNNGIITVTTNIAGSKKTDIQGALNRKLGFTFSSDVNTTTIDLTAE